MPLPTSGRQRVTDITLIQQVNLTETKNLSTGNYNSPWYGFIRIEIMPFLLVFNQPVYFFLCASHSSGRDSLGVEIVGPRPLVVWGNFISSYCRLIPCGWPTKPPGATLDKIAEVRID